MSARPAVLLLHSFGSAGRSWAAVQASLDLESHAPDLPGFGAAPALASPSVTAYADWVSVRMQAIGRPVILVGASMGGKIAMLLAARRPKVLRALVLCAPSPPTPEPIDVEERARQLAAWRSRDEADRSVRQSTLHPPTSVAFQSAVADWLATDRATWAWWWSNGSREAIDVADAAPGALILAGDEDAHLGPDVQRQTTAARLTGAELHGVAKSRHLIALDAPHAVARAIEAVSP